MSMDEGIAPKFSEGGPLGLNPMRILYNDAFASGFLMDEPTKPRDLASLVRTMRAIHLALCLGLVCAAAVLLSLPSPDRPANPPQVPRAVLAALFAACGLVALLFTRFYFEKRTRQRWLDVLAGVKPEEQQCHGARMYMSISLIRLSFFVAGPLLAQLFAYYHERDPMNLGIMVVLFGILAYLVPTESRVRAWVERQIQFGDQGQQSPT